MPLPQTQSDDVNPPAPETQPTRTLADPFMMARIPKPAKPVETYQSFIDKAFIQPFSSLMVGYFRGSASITQTLDSYAKLLEEKFPDVPGMDRGGLFEDLTKLYQERSAYWEQKGIPEGEGFASDLAQALYEGGGQFGVELPAIIALGQWGLPIYSAVTGGGVAAEHGESVLKGMAVGGLEGTALHFTLKGVRVLPRVYGEAAGGGVFGGLTLMEELKKPEGDVDWANVTAQTLLGIGLTVQGKRVPQQDFINNLRRTYAQDKTSFLKYVKSQKISDKNANKLYDKLQENETEISPELKKHFKDQLEPEPELKVEKTVEPKIPGVVEPIEFSKQIEKKYGIALDLTGQLEKGDISLSRLIVPEGKRGEGIGTKVMTDIIEYADRNNKRIVLTPTKEFGATSVKRLKDLYKRFGFVENKGKNKDFTTKESMYRVAEPEAPVPPEPAEAPIKTTPVTKETVEKLQSAIDKVETAESDLPKYARAINLERQAVPEALKRMELELAELEPKRVQTWDETGELSKQILADYNRIQAVLKKAKEGNALTTAEIDAVRQLSVNGIHRLKEIVDLSTPENAVKEVENFYHNIWKVTSDASSEAGRALNAHKRIISEGRMAKAFTELGRNMNERELREFKNLDITNPIEMDRFARRLGDPKVKDYFFEFWYNSILSGIPTHMVNITSNTAWSLFQIPHRALAGGLDKMIVKLTGKPRQRYMNEILPMMAGYRRGFGLGRERAWETIKTGEPPISMETKWTIEMGSAQGAFERSPYKIARVLSPFLTAPSRALRAMDVWANSIAYDGHINALARRTGQNRGLTGEQLKLYEKEFVKNPPVRLHQEAMEFAKYNTFMSDPGKISRWVQQGRELHPIGKLIVPFVNTIANLTKRGMEMTPGIGAFMWKGRPGAEVAAKQIEGLALTLYVMSKVDQDEITGAAPPEKTKREAFYRQGKKPWAIKMGDEWVQYRRIEPFNTPIASAAIGYDEIVNADDEETATEIFGSVADGIVKNLIDSSYLQGVTNVLDRFGKRKGAIERTVAGFVPYSSFWRSINRSAEVMMEGEAKFREAQTLFDAFSQVIPGLSGNAPAKMDIWGKEIVIEGGVLRQWLPYKWSKQTADDLELELERLGVYPGLPGKTMTIDGKKVELPDDLYREYAISLGSDLKQVLDTAIATPGYQNIAKQQLNPEISILFRQKFLQRIMNSTRNAHRQLVKEQYKKRSP